MNRLVLLILFLVVWIAVGVFVFDSAEAESKIGEAGVGGVERIVSMAPNLTEILFALGLGDQVAGVTTYSDYPAAAKTKRKVGTFWQSDIESIIACKPDLVLTVGFAQQMAQADRLGRMGYKTLTVDIESVEQFFSAIESIGSATGAERQAEAMAGGIRQKFDDLEDRLRGADRVRVLWVVQREPLRVAGVDTFVNELIELAGGVNAIGKTVHKYPPIGAEQVYLCEADVIIEAAMGSGVIEAQQRSAMDYWKRYKNVPAIDNGRIYVVDGDTVSRLGPRLYDGVEMIARYLNPDLFEK